MILGSGVCVVFCCSAGLLTCRYDLRLLSSLDVGLWWIRRAKHASMTGTMVYLYLFGC